MVDDDQLNVCEYACAYRWEYMVHAVPNAVRQRDGEHNYNVECAENDWLLDIALTAYEHIESLSISLEYFGGN